MTNEEIKEKAKEELKTYSRNMLDITDTLKDLDKYKSIRDGLKAVTMDGLPKAKNSQENYKIEDAIEIIDEDIEYLQENSKRIIQECDYVRKKIDKVKWPEQMVLKMKYKQNKKNWEIAEEMGKSKKQVNRYLEEGLNIYSGLV